MLSIAIAPGHREHASPVRWTTLHWWAFRVVFVYFVLDALPDLLLRLPGGPFVLRLYWYPWNAILPWFAAHVLHARDPQSFVLPTAPVLLGDFPGGYLLMLVFLVLAVIVASIWTVVDRRRTDHRSLHGWLRVYVRYALAFSMMGYGISKLFHVQFRALDLVDLVTPIGMLQPRALLWDFMGFSRAYQIFTGVVECFGTALLFFRRTTLLGALVIAASMANVLMLDIAYGVAVRRIALRLLLLAGFLAAADMSRLASLFVLHRPTGPANVDGPAWKRPLLRRTALAVKTIVILGVVASESMRYYHERALVTVQRPALYGVFSVERMVRDGREDAAGAAHRWIWIAIDGRGVAIAAPDGWERRGADFDDAHQTITVWSSPQSKNVLSYRHDGDRIRLAGMLDHQQAEMLLRRLPSPRFPLGNVSDSR